MERETLRLILIISSTFYVVTVDGSTITKRQAAAQSQYYLAYCPVRQGNYITYSGSLCYCKRGGQQYDCRPAGNAGASAQRPPARPAQTATLPPLLPPPVAPPPPPPPNRPSTPPNVDTRPEVPRRLFLIIGVLAM